MDDQKLFELAARFAVAIVGHDGMDEVPSPAVSYAPGPDGTRIRTGGDWASAYAKYARGVWVLAHALAEEGRLRLAERGEQPAQEPSR